MRSPFAFTRARRGRILAVKWGVNPNSSSLGVDVTFLLFGLGAVTFLTPLIGLLLRLSSRRGASLDGVAALPAEGDRTRAGTT